jgi:hypothetical protein
MIAAEDFIKVAVERNLDFYTGVPCSYLTLSATRPPGRH